jgi:hypothetical protein
VRKLESCRKPEPPGKRIRQKTSSRKASALPIAQPYLIQRVTYRRPAVEPKASNPRARFEGHVGMGIQPGKIESFPLSRLFRSPHGIPRKPGPLSRAVMRRHVGPKASPWPRVPGGGVKGRQLAEHIPKGEASCIRFNVRPHAALRRAHHPAKTTHPLLPPLSPEEDSLSLPSRRFPPREATGLHNFLGNDVLRGGVMRGTAFRPAVFRAGQRGAEAKSQQGWPFYRFTISMRKSSPPCRRMAV